MKVLIGNSWPMTLFRRQALVSPITLNALRNRIKTAEVFSFWGHENTVAAVSAMLDRDLTPREPRPTIILNDKRYPTLYGVEFRVVYIVTPKIFDESKRLHAGESLNAFDIAYWKAVQITF